MKYQAVFGERVIELEIDEHGSLHFDSQADPVEYTRISQNRYSLLIDGKSYLFQISENGRALNVSHRNREVSVLIKDEVDLLREQFGMDNALEDLHGLVHAPIPGKVMNIEVSEGERVTLGQGLIVLEAMKMENEIKSPIDGIVASIHVDLGQNVEKEMVLLEIKSEE